jgi:hypothetical protein
MTEIREPVAGVQVFDARDPDGKSLLAGVTNELEP